MTDSRRDLTPSEASERFLSNRQHENTDNTIRSYKHRLRAFVLWAEANGIETISEMDGWWLDEYKRFLNETEDSRTTVKGKISALQQLLHYCASIELVDDDLAEKIELPRLSKDEATSDEKLDEDDARNLLSFLRGSARWRGTPQHVTLELMWHVGGRISCFQALDLRDWKPDRRVLEFRHRPPTRLKDGHEHERNVAVSQPVADALELYIERERPRKRDDQGRQSLLATLQGRPSDTTIRCWAYQATQPCLYTSCPHSRRRDTCEYTERAHSSKCPSSRSPHAIRTGSITWQLNRGISYVKVAKRVAASPETIRRYYDKPDLDQELARRLPETEKLDISNSTTDQ